jgi:hypothetical protein
MACFSARWWRTKVKISPTITATVMANPGLNASMLPKRVGHPRKHLQKEGFALSALYTQVFEYVLRYVKLILTNVVSK